MIKLFLIIVSILSLPLPVVYATDVGKEKLKDKLKVAFVYVGPVGDMGWSYSHDQGRLEMEKALKGKVETGYIESVQEGPAAERVIEDYARKGYGLIITTSFGFMDATINVAKKFPKVKFVHISGYKTAENVSTVFGQIEGPFYVSGMVAGKMSKKGLVGFVAAHPIPEVIRNANAFALGVRKSNPKAVVKVVWTNTWFDPVKEKEAAVALLNAGCDIIGQDQDTAEPQKAAESKGALGIGYHTDMSKLAPKAFLTSPIWKWGKKYTEVAKSIIEGKYKSESYWGGWHEGVVDISPMTKLVPTDVQKYIKSEVELFKSGKKTIYDVFKGELKDNSGKVMVAAGKSMSKEELWNMNWLVEGVEGTVPK
ncbi:MAG: BMP family ABC transporter substrate-binding protein [Oligoflexia bacterium]|nr:BMP family ABC transporter substrate-binding protein [Oligoflexia bacterium]